MERPLVRSHKDRSLCSLTPGCKRTSAMACTEGASESEVLIGSRCGFSEHTVVCGLQLSVHLPSTP